MSKLNYTLATLMLASSITVQAKTHKPIKENHKKGPKQHEAVHEVDSTSLRVSPMSFVISDTHKGAGEPFQITAITGKASLLKAKLVRLIQKADGSLTPQNIPDGDPVLKTVKLSETSKALNHAGIWLLQGVVSTNSPSFKRGEILGVSVKEAPLMEVKEIPGAVATSRITLNYIILLKMNPELRDKKARGEIVFHGIQKDKGLPYLEASFESKNAYRADLRTEVVVRDSKGKTIDKLLLLTAVTANANKQYKAQSDTVAILPNSKVTLQGNLKPIKNAGIYTVSIESKMNGKTASVFNHSFEVSADFIDNSKFIVSPTDMKIEFVSGAVKNNPIEITNPSDTAVTVEMEGTGKIGEDLGQYGWAPTTILLAPHSKKQVDFRSINLKGPMRLEGLKILFKDKNGKLLQSNDIKAEFIDKAVKNS
ncbi:MAG: hypothetical protein H7235_02535, partial [Bdellovibrionaceae bacterium]|nr:hypothetical protein [Pseudobdellovibrionaceae bacterium]